LSAGALHSCSGRQVAPKVAPAASRSSAGPRCGQASSIPAASPFKTFSFLKKHPFSGLKLNPPQIIFGAKFLISLVF